MLRPNSRDSPWLSTTTTTRKNTPTSFSLSTMTGWPTPTASISVAFSLCLASAQGQLDPNAGFGASCPMSTFPDRIEALNGACCIPDGDGSRGECAGTCNVACIAALFPLLDDCQDVINQIYDGVDGTRDGVASSFNSIYQDCLQLSPQELIIILESLQGQGQCPPTRLDGVGETEVQAASCANVWDTSRCEMSITSGLFSCNRDFCNTIPTRDEPCVVAGQCDSSCHFCSAGHRRLQTLLEKLRKQRRMQMGHVQCDPATFAAQVTAVDTACCDADDACAGADGVPARCDAKCAVTFNTFYDRCERFLATQFSIDEMDGFDRLYSTCTTELPVEPLLRAAAICSVPPPPPYTCFTEDRVPAQCPTTEGSRCDATPLRGTDLVTSGLIVDTHGAIGGGVHVVCTATWSPRPSIILRGPLRCRTTMHILWSVPRFIESKRPLLTCRKLERKKGFFEPQPCKLLHNLAVGNI
eukprot:COSAG02_NODE_249_length_27097_cov_30.179155_17_plen_470_part_00